jgi:hypothetical protein
VTALAGGSNLALNPTSRRTDACLSTWRRALRKKVLVGGIEVSFGLWAKHVIKMRSAFGNSAGVIGFIPGQSMKLLAGGSKKCLTKRAVQVQMVYPMRIQNGRSILLDISQTV